MRPIRCYSSLATCQTPPLPSPVMSPGALVLDIGVERLAVIGPLLGAVGAVDDGPFAFSRGVGGGRERRPGDRAFVVAVRLARLVLVEGVERHALRVGPDLAGRAVHHLRRLGGECGDPRSRAVPQVRSIIDFMMFLPVWRAPRAAQPSHRTTPGGADYSAAADFSAGPTRAGSARIFSLRCPKERRKAIVSQANDGDDAGDTCRLRS